MTGNWAQFGSPVEHNPLHGFNKSPGLGTFSPVNGNNLPGLASILSPQVSNPGKIAPIGKDQGRPNQANHMLTNSGSMQGSAYQHSCSFPDQNLSTSPVPMSAFGESNSNSSGIGTLSGPQFLWGSPTPYSEHVSSSAWPTSVGHAFASSGQGQGFPHTNRHGTFIESHNHHHAGSAPSGVPLDRHFGRFPESPETSLMSAVAFGGMGLNRNTGSYMMNMGARAAVGTSVRLPRTMTENGSPSFQMMSLPRHNPMFLGNGPYSGFGAIINECFAEHARSQRVENGGNQLDSKKQYQLDLDKIISGEDARTTLMIKNIPNK